MIVGPPITIPRMVEFLSPSQTLNARKDAVVGGVETSIVTIRD